MEKPSLFFNIEFQYYKFKIILVKILVKMPKFLWGK